MNTQIVCPYCKEAIDSAAVKCKHCLEFLPNFRKDDPQPPKKISEQVIIALFDLLGKISIPIFILVLVIVYQPALQALLSRTNQAEFLGTKLSFQESATYRGTLTPIELYYLIGSANNYSGSKDPSFSGSSYSYDAIKEKGFEDVIKGLAGKGLITYKISKNPDSEIEIFGKESITITPTDAGKNFLIELGLEYNGETFITPVLATWPIRQPF